MGQKVHPLGFRLGIYENWDARWFARRAYGKEVLQDLSIRKFLQGQLSKSDVAKVVIERAGDNVRLTIHSGRPGMVIGKRGQGIDQLRKLLLDKFGVNMDVSVQEVQVPELNARLVAASIADQIERRANFRRIMKKASFSATKAGATGIKICCAGRIGGAEIARTEWLRTGSVPLHTLRSNVDYACVPAQTVYGVVGVKVWICKGSY